MSESEWDKNGEFGELDFEEFSSINIENIVIVGNIYENPELLSNQ